MWYPAKNTYVVFACPVILRCKYLVPSIYEFFVDLRRFRYLNIGTYIIFWST